jgi:hypothetical protein
MDIEQEIKTLQERLTKLESAPKVSGSNGGSGLSADHASRVAWVLDKYFPHERDPTAPTTVAQNNQDARARENAARDPSRSRPYDDRMDRPLFDGRQTYADDDASRSRRDSGL